MTGGRTDSGGRGRGQRPVRTLLFVGAHPDDETFGPGGTLATYAARGVRVVYLCATRGETGVPRRSLPPSTDLGELRGRELACAARHLGLDAVLFLGYRDSGLTVHTASGRPDALTCAPIDEVAGRIVTVMQELRPQVVLTFDPIGGFGHPDHIAIHQAVMRSFALAALVGADRPQKLYCWIPTHHLLDRALDRARAVMGALSTGEGGARDGDAPQPASAPFPVHARIWLGADAIRRTERARRCHDSQLGRLDRVRSALALVTRHIRRTDAYMRMMPVPASGPTETDLFAGLTV